VVENGFDEISFDGEFCSVTELDVVVVVRMPGTAVWQPSIPVARPPAIAANQRPRRRGRRTADWDIPARDPAAPAPDLRAID
jgi:hypothetical protein